MATVTHYEMHLGTNSYYVASNPQLSPMYDKSKKSWSQRLKITKTEKLQSPTSQQINEFAQFDYGPSGALSRSMKYAEPWLYSTVRGIPAGRPTLHYHHNGHPAIFAPIPAEVAVVICCCPEYLTGTKRDVKKASICKKCKGSRLPLAPLGGTVRIQPTSAPIIHQQRLSAATLRLPSSTKSRPSILDTQNDPYDMMRRTRLLSPDPPRESLKISNSRISEKNSSSSNSKSQNGTMSKAAMANRGRSRYRSGTGTSISSGTTSISNAGINSNANTSISNEQDLHLIAKTATIRSRSASRGKQPQSQKPLRDRWSDAGGELQIDPGGRRSILECNVNPYELISCGTMNANNEFSPPDNDDMFDIPAIRMKNNSSDAVAIAAAAAAALIKEQKNSSANKVKKLGYSNIQAIAGQRIVLGEQKIKSKLIVQNGENFLYEDIEVQAQILPSPSSSSSGGNNSIVIENNIESEKSKQNSVSFSSNKDEEISPIEFMADGKSKYQPKRPPRKKQENLNNNSTDEDIESTSVQNNNIKSSYSSTENTVIIKQSAPEQHFEITTPTTPTTPTTSVPVQKSQTIKSILKRPSSVSSQLSTNSSISDNDAKNTINQTSSTSFKSYINQSGGTHSDSVTIVEDDNTGKTNKKLLATGNSLKKSLNNQQNNEKSTRDQYNGTKVSFSNSSNSISDSRNNFSDSCNTNGNSNNKRSSGGNGGSQFYLPMPSQQQPSRKKVQFMVEDKIIQDDSEDDFNNHSKNYSEVEFENSHIISNGNNVSFIQMEENDIKENLQSNDYFSIKNNHTNITTNEEVFTKVNGKLIKTYNSNDNDVNNDDISIIKNKNKFNTKDTMNKINNGNSFNSNQDSNDDEQSCQQLILMLEQQKMQSQILDILQKQTNHLLQKNSMDLNNFNETNDPGEDDNNKNYTSANDSKRMNISLDDSNEITNNDLNKENKSLSSIISDKPNSMNLSNWTALRRTHSDRRTNLTGNTMDSSHKIQLQFNDTMALRLKNNRTVATQDLFTQEQQQQPKQQTQHRKQNENNLNSKDEQSAIQQNQQNVLYRPKEPPPPPPPSSLSIQSMATESTQIVQNDSSISSSSIFEQNYENDKNNGDESSLLLEMHSNELLQMVDSSIKKSTSSSPSVSTSTLESEIKSIGKTNNNRNSLQKNKNTTNNSYCIDGNNRNENNCNNSNSSISKKNIDKTKTATTKPLEHNQSALQSSIVSQSKGIQKQQQQPSKLLSAQQQQKQQKRHSLEQQNVQSDQKSVKVTRTPSKESLKGTSTTKPKRVSWAGSSEKIQENLITKDSITKRTTTTTTTTGDTIKEKSKINNGVTLKSILSADVNDKNSRAFKDLLKNGHQQQQQQQQQQQNNRPARPTSLPLTINNVNGTKSLTEEQKLIQAQNEISTGARLFGSSNTFLLNSSSLSSSNVTSTLPPPLHQQQPQRTVVRVAPFNTTTTTQTSTKKSGEIHRLKIKHTDDTNHNGISNGCSIDDSNGINLNNISSDNGSSFNNQKKTSILINGDDCYSTVNVSNDTSIYQSSVVVTDGTSSSSSTPVLSLTTSKNSPPITNNNMNTENKNNISKYYPSNTVTINVNSNSSSSSSSNSKNDIKADTSLLKNQNKNKESTNFESSITTNTNKRSLEDEIIYQNNKLNTLLSMNASKSIIPINVNLKTEVNKDITNTFGDTDGNNEILNENYENKNNLKSPTPKRGKTTLITLDFEKHLLPTSVASTSMESNNNDKNSDFVNGGFSNSHGNNNNFSHEEELVKILRNPVEAVKRNLVPHVCGKSDPINSTLNLMSDDNSSTISTASRTSSTSTLATVLDDPLMTRSLNKEAEYSSNNLEGFLNGTSSSSKSDRHSLVGRLLEDPTLSHLADGLESDVIVRLIESSLKRLKENRNSIDTSGTKDDEDMTKLIDISLQKIKEERHKIETAQHQQNGPNSSLVHNTNVSTHTNNNKSAIEDQQESQSNRGSISSGNSYTSANYELFEFDTNNESDCYQSCSSEITNCDEETISTQSKFYQMLVDATLSEIEITANNDDEHHYESIRVNSDPIYEEISEIPPPLPLSPPPVNETDFERKSSKSMFEGASKYDILSYLVDAKERGIVKEDNFDYTFTSGINDIILEEDRISDNNSSSGNAVNKDLRNPRNHSQNNNSINSINSGNSSSGNINITKNSSNGDISSRNSHLSITSESSEDTHSLSSSINEKLLSPSNSATNTLSSIGSQRSKTATIDIERNDSGVGSETSKSSRSKYQQQHPLSLSPTSSAGCLLDKNSPIHLCEDCDGPVETQVTESGVMFAPLVCRKCGKKRAERKEIITEIVETEEKYGRDLQIILEEFCQPMLVAGLLTQEQLSAIFLNTEELLENNQTLAERMRDALDISLEQGDDDLLTVNIGKIFLESTQMLHAFESYCVRQAAASLLLANLEKEKELLRIFLRVSQMENTVLRRMNLNSFLMVPVQRVTKYPLLLARLYKVTPAHLEGRELLKQSQEKIELHLNHMNQEAKDVPTKLWRRISSSSPNRRASCEIDMINIKLRKMAIDVLEWNHDEVRFTMEGKLLFTQPTDSNWKKGRTIKLTPVNALLVTNGKPSSNYKSDKAYVDQLHFPKHTGIREASLLLVKEKCGRYTLIREPLYMDRCIICTEADWDDYFEVHEISSKDTFIFKAEDGVRTKHWYKQLQYHSQGMGAWRKRRNALANIMINGMLSRT